VIAMDVKIIYEDNHLLVVLKPANVLSQKDHTEDEDLLAILKNYLKEKYQKPGAVYLGLVHRLDRRVGGLMVYAKTSKAASRLSESIRNGSFHKEYLALVEGVVTGEGVLKNYIRKVERNGKQYAEVYDHVEPEVKEAILEYNLLRHINIKGAHCSLLRINLLTGRYNQIRSQLAHFGHPIVNDFKYGYHGENFSDQLGLYCFRLSFPHPTRDEIMEYEYYPEDGLWATIKEE
jgi:23S rRNA pseudouridine1911/1915/1917 synthase